MADWKTYVKAARSTARKQAPAARESASRASKRAGDYVRAAGKVVEETRRDDQRGSDREDDEGRADRDDDERRSGRDDDHRSGRDDDEGGSSGRDDRGRPSGRDDEGRADRRKAPRPEDERSSRDRPADDPEDRPPGRSVAARTGVDTTRLRKDAAAYASVAQRRVRSANLGTRILRALRDALLIGGSLLAIWLVLYFAGIPIPFTTMLIAVAVIVALAFGGTLYSQFRQRRAAEADPDPEAERDPEAGRG